jgi:hypothetical protein
MDAESSFATSIRRLFAACLRSCPQTNGMAIDFVQAGQLHLPLFFSKDERTLRVHERWLSIDGAIDELGLPKEWAEVNIVFHAVKRLFANALKQLPLDMFRGDESRSAEGRRRLQIALAEQRLLNNWRLSTGLKVRAIQGCPDLLVRWAETTKFPMDLVIDVWCHEASQYSHVRDSLLISEDGGSPLD